MTLEGKHCRGGSAPGGVTFIYRGVRICVWRGGRAPAGQVDGRVNLYIGRTPSYEGKHYIEYRAATGAAAHGKK